MAEASQDRKEDQPSGASYRVVRYAYSYDTAQEEPGGITDVIQHESRSVIMRGTSKDPSKLDAHKLDMGDDRYPRQDYEDGFGPYVGDADFSYHLQVLKDGEWKFANVIKPYHVEQPVNQAAEDEESGPQDF